MFKQKLCFFSTSSENFEFSEKIKHLFKNLTPTIFKFIYYLHFKKRTNSVAHSTGSINCFEVRHLKIQDGRQLNMQIR